MHASPLKTNCCWHQRGAVFDERRSCKRQRKPEKNNNKTSGDVLSPESAPPDKAIVPHLTLSLLFCSNNEAGQRMTNIAEHRINSSKVKFGQQGEGKASPPSLRPAYQSRRCFLRPRKMCATHTKKRSDRVGALRNSVCKGQPALQGLPHTLETSQASPIKLLSFCRSLNLRKRVISSREIKTSSAAI